MMQCSEACLAPIRPTLAKRKTEQKTKQKERRA
jgi:hypothetical protein